MSFSNFVTSALIEKKRIKHIANLDYGFDGLVHRFNRSLLRHAS